MDLLPLSSPSNILLLMTFLLISHFPIYTRAGRQQSHIIGNKSFKGDCAFHLDDYNFNLCTLARTTTAAARYSRDLIKNEGIGRVEEPSSGTRFYEVALGGMSTEGCDSDTWVCMTDGVSIETQGSEDSGHHFISKKQSIPVARRRTGNSQHGKIVVIKDEETLQLFLDGGEAEGRPQSAKIEMLCDFNVESYLEFINEHDGIHSFRWTTLHGCPTNIKQSHNNIQPSKLSTTTNGADDESGSETEPEKEKDDDELLPQSGVSTARRWMAVILVIVVITVLCSSFLLTYPRARHNATETLRSFFYSLMPILSTAVIKLRPLGKSALACIPRSLLCGIGNLKPFRQGSNQLVRWAEEDMTLREADGYDEENWSGMEFDEYIPLTANPKHGRNKAYGATPDVETFEQKGGIGWLFGKWDKDPVHVEIPL